MNKLLLSLPLAILLATSSLFAQDDKPKRPRAGGAAERLKVMSEKLGLTEDQKGKIKEVFAKNAEKTKAIRTDTALAKEDKRAKLIEIRKGELEEVRGILTPEQQDKWKEMRAKRGEKQGKIGKKRKAANA